MDSLNSWSDWDVGYVDADANGRLYVVPMLGGLGICVCEEENQAKWVAGRLNVAAITERIKIIIHLYESDLLNEQETLNKIKELLQKGK